MTISFGLFYSFLARRACRGWVDGPSKPSSISTCGLVWTNIRRTCWRAYRPVTSLPRILSKQLDSLVSRHRSLPTKVGCRLHFESGWQLLPCCSKTINRQLWSIIRTFKCKKKITIAPHTCTNFGVNKFHKFYEFAFHFCDFEQCRFQRIFI